MCGIAGIVRNDRSDADQALLARMCAAIRHRGPDDDGFYVNGPVGLGMRRLAIIDLESGQQPIHNQDRTAWIVFVARSITTVNSASGSKSSATPFIQTATRKQSFTLMIVMARIVPNICAECLPSRFGTSGLRSFFWRAIVSAKNRCFTPR